MKIKIIAFDLDDTLLDHNKRIGDKTRAVLTRAVNEAGMILSVASGRPMDGTRAVLDELPVIGYAVLANGAVVADRNGRRIAEFPVKRDVALRYYDYAAQRGYICDFFVGGDRVVPPNWKEYITHSEYSEATKAMLISAYRQVEDPRAYLLSLPYVEKISMRFPTMEEKDTAFPVVVKEFPDLQISYSGTALLEAVAAGVSKATGLAALAEHLGYGMENVMAFGDNKNDIEMLGAAGIGVAMGNAIEEAKMAADRVAGSCDEDGIAWMVEEVLGW